MLDTTEEVNPTIEAFADLVRRHKVSWPWSPKVYQVGREERLTLLAMARVLPKGEVLAVLDTIARHWFDTFEEFDAWVDQFEREMEEGR